MSRSVTTDAAPQPIGPYSQAIIASGEAIYTSGMIGLDPVSKDLASGGIAAETERCLANLAAVLEAAGATLAEVVKTTVFLVDMGEFAAMNAVYERFFPETPPARTTVAVKELPRGARVEIDAIAVRGGGGHSGPFWTTSLK
jgi:2-iminobutanoate/2-iminopropanoate deaminase